MTKDNFLKQIQQEKPFITPYEIETEKIRREPFIIGVHSDGIAWTVYKTDRAGTVEVIRHTRDENSAFDFLFREIMHEDEKRRDTIMKKGD